MPKQRTIWCRKESNRCLRICSRPNSVTSLLMISWMRLMQHHALGTLLVLGFLSLIESFIRCTTMSMSTRVIKTDGPYIEDVMDKYASLPDITLLALGSVYWGPPKTSLGSLTDFFNTMSTHKYGNIMGIDELRNHALHLLRKRGKTLSIANDWFIFNWF